MRWSIIVAALAVNLAALPWTARDAAVPALQTDVAAVTGGAQCYYPNPVACVNALPEQSCIDECYWDDDFSDDPSDFFWGWFGYWACPGVTTNIEIAQLSTTTKTADAPADGWHTDQEKEDPEDCNIIYSCHCSSEPAPRNGGTWSICWPYTGPLDSPQSTFREVTGDQDCHPGT